MKERKRIFLLFVFLLILSSTMFLTAASLGDNRFLLSKNYQQRNYQTTNNNTMITDIEVNRRDFNLNGVFEIVEINVTVYANSTNNLSIGYSFYGYEVSNEIKITVDIGTHFFYDTKVGENIFSVYIASTEILYYLSNNAYFEVDLILYEGTSDNSADIIDIKNDFFTEIYDIRNWEPENYFIHIKSIIPERYDNDSNGLNEGFTVTIELQFNETTLHYLDLDLYYLDDNKWIYLQAFSTNIRNSNNELLTVVFDVGAQYIIPFLEFDTIFGGYVSLYSNSDEGTFDQVWFYSDTYEYSWEIIDKDPPIIINTNINDNMEISETYIIKIVLNERGFCVIALNSTNLTVLEFNSTNYLIQEFVFDSKNYENGDYLLSYYVIDQYDNFEITRYSIKINNSNLSSENLNRTYISKTITTTTGFSTIYLIVSIFLGVLVYSKRKSD